MINSDQSTTDTYLGYEFIQECTLFSQKVKHFKQNLGKALHKNMKGAYHIVSISICTF